MSNVAKLKKKAAEFEQKKQLDKALALYVQILAATEASGEHEDDDVALYNRVGDLMIREGNVADALTYYEKAVDLYAESGFFNNAIALCNKILRQSPGRASVYYKLGKISAKKGFKSDAKQNFLEYADRMQKAGQLDEAFRALKEFADLCPDQDDIRLMLAEQLSKRDRKGEALEQLQTLYDKLSSEGRQAEARATADRMRAIDPSLEPRANESQQAKKGGDLVFLDVSWDDAGSAGSKAKPPARPAPPPVRATPAAAPVPSGLPFIHTGDDEVPEPAPRSATLAPANGAVRPAAPAPPERGATSGAPAMVPAVEGLEATAAPGADAAHDGPLSGAEFATLDLAEAPVEKTHAPPAHDLALPGELPPLDLLTADPFAAGTLDFGNTDLAIDHSAGFGTPEPIAGGSDSFADPASVQSPFGGGSSLGDGLDALDVADGLDTIDSPFSLDVLAPIEAGGFDPLAPNVAPAAGGNGTAPPAAPPAPTADGDAAFLAMMSPPPAAPSAPAAPRSNAAAGSAASARTAPGDGARPSAEALRAQVERDEGNGELRRRYAQALLQSGEREGGLHELEMAMLAFERADDLDGARAVADEITGINPASIRHHQKRVEYAFRTNDKPRLCDAYLRLADALNATGQAEKSRAVYKRVIDLNPDDVRARAALASFPDPEPPAPTKAAAKSPAPAPARPAAAAAAGARANGTGDERAAASTASGASGVSSRPAPALDASGSFVNLGDMLRDDNAPKSTRMVVAEEEPTGDEAADFAEMLRKFKQGVAENVDDDDHQSHYDLGVAFKEMGLVDEAVAEFQKALRAPSGRARTYEALGQCFIEKRQFEVAATILERALTEPGAGDDQLVGVLYLLGYAREALQRADQALACYRRVFAVDIQFRDVAERVASLEQVAR